MTGALRRRLLLLVVVTAEGKATNIHVVKSPGMGLDEKSNRSCPEVAVQACHEGRETVDAQVPIEITFRQH